jgi:hypothetical protein
MDLTFSKTVSRSSSVDKPIAKRLFSRLLYPSRKNGYMGGISTDGIVCGNDCQTMPYCLAKKHPVKRVLVQGWELGQTGNAVLIQPEALNSVFLALFGYVNSGRFGQLQPTKLAFDNGLPDGDDAQAGLIGRVTDDGKDCGRQALVPDDVPQEDVGIQKYFHRPSNCTMISSGNGVSKSSGTRNSPAHKAYGRRPAPFCFTGLISATG